MSVVMAIRRAWSSPKHLAGCGQWFKFGHMRFRDVFKRVSGRVRQARENVADRAFQGFQATKAVKDLLEGLGSEWVDQAFEKARNTLAPERDYLPADFQLRQSNLPRRVYERLFPVSHVFKLGMKYQREKLEDYMPIGPEYYIGRGNYKFVYSLPWKMVVKIGRNILPSDPICGSIMRKVDERPEDFLKSEEMALYEFLSKGKGRSGREKLWFQFLRLGMERYQYARIRDALPEMVLPTKFFMGIRYRDKLIGDGHHEAIRPMDTQIMLTGKHLKEFARAGHRKEQSKMAKMFFPKYEFDFDVGRFGAVKKKVLKKITEDFHRLIHVTDQLAGREKLILDIHSENIIITLPDFELKIFDFHLFDEHLYEPSLKFDSPEKDHIAVLEKFVDSLGLDD